jgi:hypothetical protein
MNREHLALVVAVVVCLVSLASAQPTKKIRGDTIGSCIQKLSTYLEKNLEIPEAVETFLAKTQEALPDVSYENYIQVKDEGLIQELKQVLPRSECRKFARDHEDLVTAFDDIEENIPCEGYFRKYHNQLPELYKADEYMTKVNSAVEACEVFRVKGAAAKLEPGQADEEDDEQDDLSLSSPANIY